MFKQWFSGWGLPLSRGFVAASVMTGTGLLLAGVDHARADSTVIVTPTDTQGWVLDTAVLGNLPVATTFAGPADSAGGNGSFQFGPIGPANGAKQEMQPPEVNVLASDFGGLQAEFMVVAPSGPNSFQHFYTNIYVDTPNNGIGTFSSGFYDCRYSYVPTSGGAGWNSFSVTPASLPNGSNNLSNPACSPTLGGLPAGSVIRFFRLNGGDSSGSDNGLVGAYDLVSIAIGANTTTYDFEPYAVASDKDACKNGGWKDLKRADGSAFKNQGDCIQYVNTGK